MMGVWLSTLVLWTSVVLSVDGRPGVTVFSVDNGPEPSALLESLRIQLTGMATVDTGPALTGSQRAMANDARLLLMQSGASIAVWEERRFDAVTGKVEIVVLAVTREPPGKAIEVARVASSDDPEDERILALKVGELLYQVLSVAKSEKELAAALESRGRKTEEAKPTKPVEKALPPAERPTPRRIRGFVEAGAGLRVDSRFAKPQVGGKLGLGVGYEAAPFRAEAAGSVRRLTELELQAVNGRLTLSDVDAGASLRGLFEVGPMSMGASLGLAASFVSASATADDGRQGSANKTALSWSIGPEGRLRLAKVLEMRASLGFESTLREQRFAIEGVAAPSGTKSHESAELSLLFWFP